MAARSLNVLSLCSGFGGLDLALRIACEHVRTVCYVEREASAAATLVKFMEEKALDSAPIWDCLSTFDGKEWYGLVDVVCAGYPCQPFSTAGSRRGEADPRHLWPHVRRIVEESVPAFLFLENVPHHLSLGFDLVSRELREMGYLVAGGLATAAEVGDSQRRERLFVLACREGQRWAQGERSEGSGEAVRLDGGSGAVAGANCDGPDSKDVAREQGGSGGHSGGSCENVAKPGSERREGSELGGAYSVRWEGPFGSVGELCMPPFPPGPEQLVAWEIALTHCPELAPAVGKTALAGVCGLADGAPSARDQIRLLGNGVVPLAGAYAFAALWQRVEEYFA